MVISCRKTQKSKGRPHLHLQLYVSCLFLQFCLTNVGEVTTFRNCLIWSFFSPQIPDYNYRAEIKKLIPHLKCLDEIPASQTALPFPCKMNKDWLMVKESIKDGNFVEEAYGLGRLNYFARHIFYYYFARHISVEGNFGMYHAPWRVGWAGEKTE